MIVERDVVIEHVWEKVGDVFNDLFVVFVANPIDVLPGQKIAVLQAGTAGKVTITELL